MKSHRRISVKLILALSLTAALFVVYLEIGLFPGGLKQTAVNKIEALTELKVQFDKAVFLPFQGLSFYNLKVMKKNGAPIFSSKRLSINVRLIPFLREKRIVVNHVYLDAPVYDFSLEAPMPPKKTLSLMTKISGQIPIPVIPEGKRIDLTAIQEGPGAFLPENVYLEQIEIVNGKVTVRKNTLGPPVEEINSLRVRMSFHKPPILSFEGSLQLGQTPYSTMSLRGNWDLEKAAYEFYFQAKSQKIPGWLLEYQKTHFLVLKNGAFLLSAHLKSIEEERALFHSKTEFYGAEISLNKTVYAGQMAIDVKGVFNFETKLFETYRGRLNLKKVDIFNLSQEIPRLENIGGDVDFEPELLKIDSVHGQYKKIDFKATGSIHSFKDPRVDLDIHVDSKISEVLALFPKDQKKLIEKFEIQGACHAVTAVRGPLKKPTTLRMEYKLLLNDISLRSKDKKINLSGISAEILANDSGFKIQNCRFAVLKRPYLFNAFVPKNPKEKGTLTLGSKELKLSADYALEHESLLIKKGNLYYFGISADFQGKLPSLNASYLELQGDVKIPLNKLTLLLAPHAPGLKEVGLKGTLEGPFTLNGLWNDPLGWDFRMDGKADPLFIKQTARLDHFEIQVRLKDKVVHVPYFHALPYEGTLGGEMSFMLSNPAIPFRTKVYTNRLNLSKLMQNLNPKQKDFAGTAIFQVTLGGLLKRPESYLGGGSVDIQHGRLWQTNLFKEMGDLPLVKVEGLDWVTFHSLSSTFEIHHKKIWTKNLNLFGDTVNLSLDGTIGFDQKLDLTMNIQYSKDIIRGAFDTGGIVPYVVQEAENFISQYKISGTLRQPKYDKMMLPVGRMIGKKISGLFQAVVQ